MQSLANDKKMLRLKKIYIYIVNYSHQQTSIGNIMERAADTQYGQTFFGIAIKF